MTVRDAINSALDEELARDSKVYILGEEVWRIRCCVYHDLFVVTTALITLLHDLPVDHGLQVRKGLQLQPVVKSAHTKLLCLFRLGSIKEHTRCRVYAQIHAQMIVEQSCLAANAYSNTGSHAHNRINRALPYMGTHFFYNLEN
jgi:hypothetical protein